MCKNKVLEKLLAIILIFTLTFANFAFITKSYASSFAEALFGASNDTGSKSVDFDAYFEIEGEHATSILSDVNNKELFINMSLKVKDKGYLKDAKIGIVEAEEGKGVNFDIRENFKEETQITEIEEIDKKDQEEVETNSINQENANNENISENEEKTNQEENEEEKTENEVKEEVDEEKNEKENVNNENQENELELQNQENVEEVKGISEIENQEEKTVEELIEEQDHLESFEDNTFYLNQITGTSEMKLQVPIEYKNEQYVNEEKVLGDALIVFSGTYVNNKGDEVEVSKQVKLNVGWKDERKVELETQATKYINYGEGVILQTLERIDNSAKENTLPVKTTELDIEVPVLKQAKPSKITVVANTTKGTNGKETSEVTFDDSNWVYNEQENKLKIQVNNEKQKVEINNNEKDFIQDEEKEKIEEERYYNGSGIDEFLVTYTYDKLEVGEETLEANSKAEVKMTTISGEENENNQNVVTTNKEYKYELSETTGDIVSLNIENKAKQISKAYTYVNYNNEGKYEIEMPSEMVVNISYKDLVEGIQVVDEEHTYVDKNGEIIPNNDIYYKKINISKQNFEKILGQDGEIRLKDEKGNVFFVINKDTKVDDKGNIELIFEQKYSKIIFETTKPIGEGNLVISTIKATSNPSIDKEQYTDLEKIKSKTSIKANYNYVEGIVNAGEIETEEKLLDTTTGANLVIDRESLSTVEENKDVEMRIELNNAKETSDIYGDSHFEIEFPENIENINVTNLSLLYGEGLELQPGEIDGRTIKIDLSGKQEGINSGVLTNGTNIVLNANIKVNLFAPAKSEQIKLRYTNSEATNYVDEGYKEVGISYSAPTGLVAVNSISNYNNEGTITTSVRQGKKEGIIPVYGETRTAQNEIIVMNNNNNTVSNMSILGRIPYAGVKDLQTGEELGTTLDSKLVNGIVGNERNRGEFIVYYSENGEATKDLNSQENGWIQNPQNLENIKSYLIVPVDENYSMEKNEILRFSYNYVMPENLKHNEYFYGTFGVYYRNNSEVAKTNEFEVADLVGLTTGVGPELKLTVTPSKEQVKEYEEFALNVLIENVGEVRAENINVEYFLKSKAMISRFEANKEGVTSENVLKKYFEPYGTVEKEKAVTNFKLPNLEVGDSIELKIYLTVFQLGTNTYFKDGQLIVENLQTDYIEPEITLTATDLGIELFNKSKVEVKPAELYIFEHYTSTSDIEKAGNEITLNIRVENKNANNSMNNVIISKTIPKEFTLVNATEGYNYDEASRVLQWNIASLEKKQDKSFKVTLRVNELDENLVEKNVTTDTTVKADNTDIYTSNSNSIYIARPVLVITQTSSNESTYVKEGETLKYTYMVRNEGKATATFVNLSEIVPEGIGITKINYKIDNIETNKEGLMRDNVKITTHISPGSELLVNLEAVALSLDGAQEKTVSNYATVNSKETKEIKSNSITHIVEALDNNTNRVDEEPGIYTLTEDNIQKTYKISGLAWLDSNKDGMRSNDEELFSGVVVKLIDSTTGVIQDTLTTDTNGEYVFTGIKNGTYLIVFEYDNKKYTVTTYQKDGIASNVNSDAVLTTISQEGKEQEGAVTDIIKVENGSVSNIDIGLNLINIFDLKLDKTISKVMVQTSKETVTENYNNVSLAKAEIASKYLSGATVYVEYTIIVSNIGDISGYAKKIVDYIPNGMTFNSALDVNSGWYTGTDGNLYSEALQDKELKSGESATVKLILSKQMTEENTGIVNNLAEIYEDYNTYGITDKNSTPGNKVQSENDLGSADVIISIKTGEVFIYISVIVTSILLGSIVIFITYNKLSIAKRKKVI